MAAKRDFTPIRKPREAEPFTRFHRRARVAKFARQGPAVCGEASDRRQSVDCCKRKI
jgi:hypothetical protein